MVPLEVGPLTKEDGVCGSLLVCFVFNGRQFDSASVIRHLQESVIDGGRFTIDDGFLGDGIIHSLM